MYRTASLQIKLLVTSLLLQLNFDSVAPQGATARRFSEFILAPWELMRLQY